MARLGAVVICAAVLAAGCEGGSDFGKAGLFTHSKHFLVNGSHSNFSCDKCHDPAATTFTVRGGGVDCLGCHGQAATAPLHSGVSGFAWATDSCVACHKSGSATAVDHAQFFPIAAPATHSTFGCLDCHGATKATQDLRCTSCHSHEQAATDGVHGGLAGYKYDSPSCYSCHKDGKVPAFDHTLFPIATGTTHAPFTCKDCHGATRAVADLQCTSCHTSAHAKAATDTTHAGVSGYQYDSPSCYNCHKDGTAGLPADHNTAKFPVTGTKHASVGCGQCHGATKAIADVSCVPCHTQSAMATKHASVPASVVGRKDKLTHLNYQWASAYCLKCHANGQVDRIASHPSVPEGINGGDHRPFCLACHPALGPTGGKAWGANFKSYSCLYCHSSNNP